LSDLGYSLAASSPANCLFLVFCRILNGSQYDNSGSNMGLFTRLVSLLCILFFGAPLLLASPQVFFVGDGLRYLTEEQPLRITDLIQKPESEFRETHNFQPNLGFTSKVIWFFTAIENPGPWDVPIIFEVAYPRLEGIDLYAVNDRNEVVNSFHLGTEFPGELRPIRHMNFAFPLQLGPGQKLRLYIRTHTGNPLRFPVRIWEPETFRASQQSQQLIQGLYYGSIIIMVLYNLFVYFGTRNRSYIFYCIFVSCTACYLASDGGILLRYIFKDSSVWNNKITLLSILGANIFGIYFATFFMNLRKRDPSVHRHIRWINPILAAMAITVFIFPYHLVGIFFTGLSTLTSGFLIVITARGIWRRQREAYFYAAAWTCLLLGTFAYGLLSLGFIEANFFTEKGLQIGSFFEVTILSFALADRLNQMRLQLKGANAELAYQIEHVEEQVLAKTRDIRSIMEHIPLGVCSILPGLVVHRDYSRSLESLFHTRQIEGQNVMELLFDHALISEDQKSQIKTALMHAMGEEALAFEINRHCFIDQVVVSFEGQQRILNLLWNPVCNDQGLVEKVLVTVHDSTRLLTLEHEAETQKHEMTLIKSILDIPAPRFQSFLRQAQEALVESRELLEGADSKKNIKLILMSIHTLKGNARSLFFSDIADRCHDLEEAAQQLSQADMIKAMDDLEILIQTYETIAVNKLGRKLDAGDLVELKTSLLRRVVKDLMGRGLVPHVQELQRILYRPLPEVLQDILKSSGRLADELGKARPEIRIHAEGLGIAQDGYDALTSALIHLLRNSLDHGLESPDLRQRKGKPTTGIIDLSARIDDGALVIRFQDDGQGLALEELKNLGLKRGVITPESPSQAIAELVFIPDLSTRTIVSSTSGRGVGLPAVRDILQKVGGDARLILLDSDAGFQKFAMDIHLPEELWTHFHAVPRVA